jgi:hypothetical protein
MNTEQKLEALIKFEGKISALDKTQAIRLARKLVATGELTLMEEMTVDSLAEIYEVKEVKEIKDEDVAQVTKKD